MILTADQTALLRYAARENASDTATHWFAYRLASRGQTELRPSKQETRRAYLVLRSLAKVGLMEGVSAYSYSRVRWWKITSAGLDLIKQEPSP